MIPLRTSWVGYEYAYSLRADVRGRGGASGQLSSKTAAQVVQELVGHPSPSLTASNQAA